MNSMLAASAPRSRGKSALPSIREGSGHGPPWPPPGPLGPLRTLQQLYRRKKRALLVAMVLLELLYLFVSVPLRIGFLFDPYAAGDWETGWTSELTVLTVLDVLADMAALVSLLEIFHAQRRDQAAIAVDATGAMGGRRRRPTSAAGRGIPLERRGSLLARMRDSLIVTWSLNTIIPAGHLKDGIHRKLLLELMSMVPLELLVIAFGPNSLHLLRALKVLRLYRVPACLRELKQMYTGRGVVQMLEYTGNALLFNTVMMGFASCHWIACAYMAIAHFECGIDFRLCSKADVVFSTIPGPGPGGTAEGVTAVSPTSSGSGYTCWAIEEYLVGSSLARQYSRAAYWASRSVVTAGFYDVAPVTNAETVYAILVQIVGAIFITAVLATFLFIFRYRNARTQEFMAHVDSAKEYMQMRHFPESVREGVLGYYKNAWAVHRALHHGEVIERLPGHLRVSVYSVLKVQRIQNVAFLAKESVEFVNTLALRIEHCVYSPKDWIIDKLPDGMYFVLRGSVFLDGGHSQSRFAKAGDHFAESCLLYPGKSDDRARAQTFCDLYKLPQRAFYNTLSIFYRGGAATHLESMRSMHMRRDQQEQKMKRMLGRSAESASPAEDHNVGLNSGTSFNRSGGDAHGSQRPPWRMPGSSFRKWWEHARLLALVFVAFEVPLFIVFDAATYPFGLHTHYSLQSITSIFVEGFFVADFALRCRYFAFIDQLALIPVSDPTYIFDAYRANGMWLDLLAAVPVSLVAEFAVGQGSSGWPAWLPLFRLARLLRTRYLNPTIQEIAHIRGLSSKVQRAGTMLLFVTLTVHVTGCLWFLMARLSMTEDEFEPILEEITRDRCLRDAGLFGNCSWALYDAYGQIGTTFEVQDPEHSTYTAKVAYLRSIYWAIVALTTVGTGDIVAFSTYESYFAALWVFVGGIINYGVVGAMSNIISNLTASSRHHSEKMNAINVTLGHFRISEGVRARIRQYYHQQFYVQKVTSEAQLLAGLPVQLRHRISNILHAESVRKVPLFVEAANEHLLYELTGLFRRQLFQRGDPFFPESNLCEEMYVVVSGRANIFSKRVGAVPVGALSAGDCFGVCELLLQKSLSTTVVAATVVDASVITYAAFVATIERHFPAEVNSLRQLAMQQHVFDTLSLEAVIDNLKLHAKFTEHCTSMFEEKENWLQQRKKMRRKLYWDLIILLLDIYNAFQVTFRIGFLSAPSHNLRLGLVALDFVGDALLLVDIYLKLYYFECEGAGLANLLSRVERDDSYVAGDLRGDLLSSLPLYYVGSSFLAMSLCRLPRLLRLRQVPGAIDSLIMRLQQRFSAGGNISAYLGPFKLVFILLFTGHLAACVFYLICHADHNSKSWTHHDPIVHLEHGSVGVLYLRAFYWAITTLTLVGSREIVPLSVLGTLWATLTCLCCTFIVGHIVGELSELVLEMDKTKKELKERESHFDQFARDHELPASIRTRVLHYLKFQHTYLKGMDIYETFSDLSPNLRVQLMLDLHGATLQHLCIAPFLNQAQINGLAVRLKSELFIPGDIIIVEGDLGHKLYIVKGGTGMVLWKSTGTAVATITAGSLFGEVAFFLRGQRRIASVQATTCSELLVLSRRAWEELLASSPRDEAEATERALVRWVQDCLKGYNVMTVEIVKNIKFAGGDGDAAPKLPHIEQLRELKATPPLVRGASGRTPSNVQHKYSSAAALEEKKVRQLLKKTAANNGSGVWRDRVAQPPALVLVWRWLTGRLLSGGRRVGRVYAEGPADEVDGSQRSLTVAAPPGLGRQLFPRRGGKNAAADNKNDNTLLSLVKSKSFRIGTAMQINPVSRSMREYYCDEQLVEMEDECWRRYKVSLLMAEAITGGGRDSDELPLPSAASQQQVPLSQAAIGSAQVTGRTEEDAPVSSRSRGPRVSRKTFCGAMMPGVSPQRATRTSVTTDGMRFLANYESRNRSDERRLLKQPPRGKPGRHLSFSKPHAAAGAARAHRRQRKLKRSQSLPLFDRHFAHMVREELQESSAKDSESKPLTLGFELLQRCRQPEFSRLFQLYLAWLKRKHRWRLSVSKGSSSGDSSRPAQDASPPALSGGATTKAEDFLNLLSRCYRLWEWLAVLVGMFYAVTLPFFLCFEVSSASASEGKASEDDDTAALAHWSRVVACVDAFCLLDLALKTSAFHGMLHSSASGGTDVPKPPRHSTRSALSTVSFSSSATGAASTPPPPHPRWRVNYALWLQVASALPLELLLYLPPLSHSSLTHSRWFYLALFQLNKVPRIFQSIEGSERLTQFLAADLGVSLDENRLHFTRSLCWYVLSGHCIACLWFRVGLYGFAKYGQSWLSTFKMCAVDGFDSLHDIPTTRRYLRALHFAIGSITTAFYGDIAGMNALETTVEIALIVVCILLFGVLVGAQGERIEAQNKHKMLFEQHLSELFHFLKHNEVPRDVRQRLRLYYSNTWLKFHGHDDLEGVRGLSTLLVEDIAQFTLRDFASKVSILKSCDECFLRSLLTRLKPVICSAAEAVVRKGDVDRSMYLIARGKVLVQGLGFELVKQEGDFFGELSLLYGIPRSATCASLGVSLLYVLEWEAYEKLLADYPEYREQNRREWVVVSTVLKTGESRFRSIIDIVARMEKANWVLVDDIIRKAKNLK